MPHTLRVPSDGQSVTNEEVNQLTAAICLRIKEHRLEQELSVNRLAQMAGLNEKAIRLIEKEERMPPLPTAIRLTKALGLKLSDLVSDAEGRVPNDSP